MIPIPTVADWIMLMSFPPSPMARVKAFLSYFRTKLMVAAFSAGDDL